MTPITDEQRAAIKEDARLAQRGAALNVKGHIDWALERNEIDDLATDYSFLIAIYTLTEIDAVYDKAQEYKPCEACDGVGTVYGPNEWTGYGTPCGECS